MINQRSRTSSGRATTNCEYTAAEERSEERGKKKEKRSNVEEVTSERRRTPARTLQERGVSKRSPVGNFS